MKTRLFILILLIVCYSCGTNNKPVSDAQKEKIKGEVKEVVNTFYKGCEDVNFDMVIGTFLDSPDFVFLTNGNTYGYKEVMAMRPNYNGYLNQKCTSMLDEKYTVLDNSTVLYTARSKWVVNYKDGHSSLADPDALLFIFKKIDSKWKIIYYVDSYVNKNVLSESSKGLNQAELLKKFVGNWEIPSGKDTSEFVTVKSLQGGNGLSVYAKWVTKGKMLFEGTGFWGYDAAINKIDISILLSTGDVVHDNAEFTSPTKLEYVNINNAKAYQGISKSTLEFISPDEIKLTVLVNNNPVLSTWKRIN
jgi:hypothetical protein